MPQIQIQPIIAPRAGIRKDLPGDLISDLNLSDALNVFFQDGLIKKRHGYKKMGNTSLPLSGAIVGFGLFEDFIGNKRFFALTTRDLYKWNPTTGEWIAFGAGYNESTHYGYGAYGEGLYGGIGAAAYGAGKYGEGFYGEGIVALTSSFTGLDTNYFSSDYLRPLTETDPWWIFTNGVDDIKKFTSGTQFTDLGGSPPKAKHLVRFKDYLLLLDVTEGGNRYPQRVRWCNTANPEEWNTGNASYQDLPGTAWITGGIRFKGDYVAIFTSSRTRKENSIWVGYATGDTDIFQFDRKVVGVGCPAGNTIRLLTSDVIIFLGWDDVYLFDGVHCQPIAAPVQRELIYKLNPAQMERCFGVIIEEQKEYWLFIPSANSTYPDIAWVYNYKLNSWTKHKASDYLTTYGHYEVHSSITYADLVGSYNAQRWRFNDRTVLASTPTLVFGDIDGYVYEYDPNVTNDDGDAINGYFDTKDFNFTNLMSQQRVTRMDTSWIGSGLDVYYSTDQGVTWNLIKSLGSRTTFDRQKLSFRISSDWVRFRFRNNADNGWFSWNRGNIYWQKGGRI